MIPTLIRRMAVACSLTFGVLLIAVPAHAENPDIFRVESVTRDTMTLTDLEIRHTITDVTEAGSPCTLAQLYTGARRAGAPRELYERTFVDDFDQLRKYVARFEGESVVLNIFECKSVSPSAGYLALVCADESIGRPKSGYIFCAQGQVDTEVNQTGTHESASSGSDEESDPRMIEEVDNLNGTGRYDISANRINLRLTHVDDTQHRFQFGRGSMSDDREHACRTPQLFRMLAETPAEVGDVHPRSSFDQLLQTMLYDDNSRGFVWYGECESQGVSTSGLLCVDPYNDTADGVSLRACAYVEGENLNR